ncbi:hypothetical protein [Butyrivibrio sp. INlla16]|uniref:hypothetical protein n=1 Tax=Butyrivibrio sp. INlla16 TaxID=1520807 RepID=UPI00088A15B9|nr:hypothetical protein [Butyrivibrio sp. INlla16]SDB19819.1 hypothetical protein SAMN02910263_00960 [Butyrivibrio sp. INlla16]
MKRVCLGATKLLMVITIMLIIVYGRGITAKAVNVTYEKEKVINLVNKKMTGYINAINVNMDEVDTHVANVKTSNKNLKAKCVSHRYKYSVNTNYEAIQIYATRKGTYYVTFDIVDGKLS